MGRGSLGLYSFVLCHGLRSSNLCIFTSGPLRPRSDSPGLGSDFAMLDLVVYRSQSVGRLLVSNFLLLHSKRSL